MSDLVRYVTIIERFHKWDVNKMGKSINLLAIIGIIVTILSIAVIVISILFVTQSWDIFGGTIRMSDYIQYGFWISLIGAIITLIGGIMPIAKNRMN